MFTMVPNVAMVSWLAWYRVTMVPQYTMEPFSTVVTLQHGKHGITRYHGTMVPWYFYASVVPWHQGTVVRWSHGTNGTVPPW